MKALVLGGGGFLGRRLVARLQQDGWRVGQVARGEDKNEVLALGVGERADFDRLIAAFAPDVIFHLAGRMSGSAEALYHANVVLAVNLLQAVERAAVAPTVLLTGSAAEYGRVDGHEPADERSACRPVTDYGVSKLAQTLTGLVRAEAGLPVVIARVFNPLGAGMPAALALPNFAHQIVNGASETLHVGDLDVYRDFIAADEAVRLMAALPTNSANHGKIFNICSGAGFQLRGLVETLIRFSGRAVNLVVDPARLRANDVKRVVGSTARLRAAGLTPEPPDMDCVLHELLADARAASTKRP